ncbi:MAG TPA: UDP-N-acetylglucosamine 2-epimerase, partial [Bacteroidales bacterium]|nr:UDP-N-acetylglucosamine 2-epimerase [Bacteroidales bacterium]
ETLPLGDKPRDISEAIGKTISAFAPVWEYCNYDIVFALGDRYEMFAAVLSALPYNRSFAHIHGGETTHGAIDNSFRNAISLMSTLHFTTTDEYRVRVISIIGSTNHVYNVGALSIDNIKAKNYLSIDEFYRQFNIDLRLRSVLVTFHPETVTFEKNENHINEIISVLNELKDFQIIITMPNADTMGLTIRKRINEYLATATNSVGIESLGSCAYLTCIKYCSFMLGNSSSGFVEAAGFDTPVVNLGNRQQGRIVTDNIFCAEIEKTSIIKAVYKALNYNRRTMQQIYGDGSASEKIIRILKEYANEQL